MHEMSHQFNVDHCGGACCMNTVLYEWGIHYVTWCDACINTLNANANRRKGYKQWLYLTTDYQGSTDPTQCYYHQRVRESSITINATPYTSPSTPATSSDYHLQFKQWVFTKPTAINITDNPYTFTITADTEAEATFIDVETLTISVTGKGTTNPPPGDYIYEHDTYATVTAIPNSGYVFLYWILYGYMKDYSNPISVEMWTSRSLVGCFSDDIFCLTISILGNGITDPPLGQYYYYRGETVTLTALPKEGYQFRFWLINSYHQSYANPTYLYMDSNYIVLAGFVPMSSKPSLVSGGSSSGC